ncbi:MAG: vitamin K epoxide reductase family protein [Candidatus Thermoplasmatota archaeon]
MASGLSRGDLLLLIAVLAVFGAADAAYLTWQWYEAASSSWCDLSSYFSCSRVRASEFSSVGGIPTALIAVAGFLILLVLVVLAFRGVELLGPWSLDRWLLVFAGIGALLGLGLTLVEIFVIAAICILCVIGFAIDLGILFFAWRLDNTPLEAEA